MTSFTSREYHDDVILSSQEQDDDKKFHCMVETLIPANVWMISGCHSLETSADISNIHNIGK
jgi:hypothetical protein